MLELRRPRSWWGWAFRFAAAAEKALALGGESTALYLDYAAENAIAAAMGQLNWFETRYAQGDEDTPSFALACVLARVDMREGDAFAAGHGRAFLDLRDKRWAKLDAGMIKLTKLGSRELLKRGVLTARRAMKPGPVAKKWDDEIQDDDD